jgi:type II secretory pathway pseudopilin PulG
MTGRQRNILIEFLTVIIITAIAVIGMVNFKDYVNRSESMQAMNRLGRIILQYRKTQGAVPPESYIEDVKEELAGLARLGSLQYRARWITLGAGPDEILAYVKKNYHSLFFSNGYIVLRLDGRVEWMEPNRFETTLVKQQRPEEIEAIKK